MRAAFAAACGLALCIASFTADAQSVRKTVRVATLWTTSRSIAQPYLDAIEDGLRELGWASGRNLVLENRFTDGHSEALPALAAEVVASRPDVAVAPLNPAALALKRLTDTMPIVFVVAFDPVGTGLAASLSHPGANATGMTVAGPETAAKRLQILREAVPAARRVGVVGNAAFPGHAQVRAAIDDAARDLNFAVADGTYRDAEALPRAFEALSAKRVDTLIVLGDNLTHLQLPEIVAEAARKRWPAVYSQSEFCDGGGLVCYGVDLRASYRRSALFIDRILRGASPSDIPIEAPRTYILVVNLGTARTLGIDLPQSLRLRADRLIE